MDCIVRGTNKKIKLGRNQEVAAGGEGRIFAKGNTAYKIYHDPKAMIPLAKIDELAVLDRPTIIRPLDVLLNPKHKPIGFTMRFIKERDRHFLARSFTKTFRQANGLTPDNMFKIVQKMQDSMKFVHSHNILLVDVNELNFLLTEKFDDVLFIDVNSYQTPHFPATAIMDTIRDWQSSKFSEVTDWFSFGIVSFQMFVGIHPFKGKYQGKQWRSVDEVKERILSNISVLRPEVSVPKSCQSFDVIPPAYKQWYKAVFDQGKRVGPPDGALPVLIVSTKIDVIKGNDNFEIVELESFDEDVISFQSVNGNKMTMTENYLYVGKRPTPISLNTNVAVTPRLNHVVSVSSNNRMLNLFDATAAQEIKSQIACENFMCYGGRIYVKSGPVMNEVNFVELPNQIQATSKTVANVLENAARIFDGVVIQNLLGACYVSIFPESGKHYQFNIKEMNGHRIVDAKFDNNVLMIVREHYGKYDRLVVRFSPEYGSYDITIHRDVDYVGLNFIVLDNGVAAYINEDEHLELFSNKYGAKSRRIVEDPVIGGDMKLFKDGVTTIFAKLNKLYRLKMK